ncbi:MAG: inositol monophosphatase [Fimbriimonadaceae bacterium]|nr:inositol monophosphatase [Fimbriimonadaceae bacterium]
MNHAELRAVVALAEQAGAVLRAYWRQVKGERKRDQTLVSDADRRSEELLREALQAAFPGECIVGEEFGVSDPGGGRAWFVDPLDGTTNFVHRIPFWCVGIGLLEGGRAVGGVVHCPLEAATYYGAAGLGAWRDAEPLTPWPGEEPFTGTDPVLSSEELAHDGLAAQLPGKMRMLGSAVYHGALVAAGAARGAVWHRGDMGWDLIPALGLCVAAGATVSDYCGELPDLSPLLQPRPQPWSLLAAAPPSHAVLLAALQRAGAHT